MNAFEAASATGRDADLAAELTELFDAQNVSTDPRVASIPATFLRVTVDVRDPSYDADCRPRVTATRRGSRRSA